MELKRSHFPFFMLVAALLVACTQTNIVTDHTDPKYNDFIKRAQEFAAMQLPDSAFYYYNKAKNKESFSADQQVYAILCMAEIQRMLGDFSGSESTTTEALDKLPETTVNYYTTTFNVLGIVYKETADYENALKYYRLSLKHASDPIAKAIVKNNIAVVYMDMKNYGDAIPMLQSLIRQRGMDSNDETRARILDNLGYSYFATARQDEGLMLMDRSLALRLKSGDDFGVVSSYLHLAEALEKQDIGLSEQHALNAYRVATKIKSVDDRLKALAQLIKTANLSDAKKYSLIHLRLNDSINHVRQTAKNQFAKVRYDDAKTKEENANLKLEKASMKFNNLLLLVGGTLAVVILILLFIIRNFRHKREKQEQVHKTEKAISKKVHDVLANDLYNLMSFTKTSGIETPKDKALLLRNLNSIYLATRDIAHQTGEIQTGPGYPDTLTEMMQLYNDQETRITIKGLEHMMWEAVSPSSKRTIYRLIQELLVNLKKHSGAPLVLFDFSRNSRHLVIGYKENGVDFQSDKDVLRKVLQNVENHIGAINGQVIFDSTTGRITISIPVK